MRLFITTLILTAILLYFVNKNYSKIENYVNFLNFTRSSLDTIYDDSKLPDQTKNNFERLPPFGNELDKPVDLKLPEDKNTTIDMLPEIKQAKQIQLNLQKCPDGFYECLEGTSKYCSPIEPETESKDGNGKCKGEKFCRLTTKKDFSNVDVPLCETNANVKITEKGDPLPVIRDPNQVCVNVQNLMSNGVVTIQDMNGKYLAYDYNDGVSNVYIDNETTMNVLFNALKTYISDKLNQTGKDKFFGVRDRPVKWQIEFAETPGISCDILISNVNNKHRYYLDIKNDQLVISPFRGGTTQRFCIEPIENTAGFYIKSKFNNKYISYTNRGGIRSGQGNVYLSEDIGKNNVWKFHGLKGDLINTIGVSAFSYMQQEAKRDSQGVEDFSIRRNKDKVQGESDYYSMFGTFWTPRVSTFYNGTYDGGNNVIVINLDKNGNGTVSVVGKSNKQRDTYQVKQIGKHITSTDNNPNRNLFIELITGAKLFTFKSMPQIKVRVRDNHGLRSLCGKEPLNFESVCYKMENLKIKTVNENKTPLDTKTEFPNQS